MNTQNTSPVPRWVGVKAATNILGMSAKRLRAYANEGRIPCIRTAGNCRRFDLNVLHQIAAVGWEKWLEERWIQRTPQPNMNLPISPMIEPKFVREVTSTTIAAFFVCDDGLNMYAGFGYLAKDDGNPFDAKTCPEPNAFSLFTDSTTRAKVDHVLLAIDPFVYSPELLEGPESLRTEVLRSYTRMFTALLAGQVTINGYPYPAVIPVQQCDVICMPVIPNTRAVFPTGPMGRWNRERGIELPPAYAASVYLNIPTRMVRDGGYEGRVWTMTGLIQITQVNYSHRGAVAPGEDVSKWPVVRADQSKTSDPVVEAHARKEMEWVGIIISAIKQRRVQLGVSPETPMVMHYDAQANSDVTQTIESSRGILTKMFGLRALQAFGEAEVAVGDDVVAIPLGDDASAPTFRFRLVPFASTKH